MSRKLPARPELEKGLTLAGRQLSTATIMFHQAIADRLGLNVTDHKCMDLLLLNGSQTAGDLARLTGLTTGAITAVIDRLEKAGFLRREDDPNDRRRVILQAVPKRCREIERLFEPFAATFGGLNARYNDQELAVILDFMTRSREALGQSTAVLRQEGSRGKSAGRGQRKRAVARGRNRFREEGERVWSTEGRRNDADESGTAEKVEGERVWFAPARIAAY